MRDARVELRLPALPAVGLAAAGAALLAAALPLLTYTVSLAAFGLVHVLAELRYVDARFTPRTGRRLRVWLAGLLAAVVVLRALDVLGALPAPRAPLELGLVVLLAAGALPHLLRRGALHAAVGLALVALVGGGILLAPALALLALAFLHNLTPVGFLAERLEGRERRAALAVSAVVFGLVPLAIALGLPRALLAGAGLWAPEVALPGAGPLERHLGAYLPAAWWFHPWALDLFAAAVYLQCMHYAAVIHVLPRLADPDDPDAAPVFAWPSRRWFQVGLAGAAGLTLLGFLASFGEARAIYGVVAAVHAWVELPLLLLGLALAGADPAASPLESPQPVGAA